MAGFGRNGSRSSAKAIASAERHGVWIALRRQGYLEADITRRFGVSKQAVSKAQLAQLVARLELAGLKPAEAPSTSDAREDRFAGVLGQDDSTSDRT
jgi:transposase